MGQKRDKTKLLKLMVYLHQYKNLLLAIWSCLLINTSLFAKNTKLDSLQQIYDASDNPVQRTQLLHQICELPNCFNLELAYTYAQKAYEEAQKTDVDTLIAISQIKLATVQYKMGKLQESEANLNAAVPIFEQHHLTEKIALANNCFGITNGMRRNNQVALKHFTKALKTAQSDHLKLRIYNNLVQVYQSTGKYGQALDCINQYSSIAKALNDENKILNAHFLMAALYVRQRNLKKSQEYLDKIIPLVKSPRAKYRLADIYHNTAVSLIQSEKYTPALTYNQKALELREELNDKVGLINSYVNSGIIHTQTHNFPLALEHLKKGWEYNKESDNNHKSMIINYGILAFVLDSLNTAYDEGILKDFELNNINELIEQLEFNCSNSGDFCLSSSIHQLLLKYYVDNGDIKKAFVYQNRLIMLKDSIFAQSQRRSVSEFDFKLYTKDKEKELSDKAHKIAVLEKDQLEEQSFRLYGMGAFLILLAVLLLINSNRKQLQKEKELTAAQLENTQLVLLQKKQELNHFAQQIISKNKLIQQLEVDLESVNDHVPDDNQQEKIQLLRQQKILTQEDWDNFKSVFLQVYPSFMDKMNQKFDKLTPAELRMFMLLKLDLSKQQIAEVLGISAESVRKTKYRLKKKLQLGNEQDLEVFAKNFE